jgi:predicted ABC-type ATPase
MENIFDFTSFNEEVSKNTPIPELFQKNKLGIILLGLPGSGKSTFAKNFIAKYQNNIKSFSTDDVSLKFTKDPTKYHVGSSELNIEYLINYMKSGQNFIYDTTGTNDKAVFDVFKSAKRGGYKVIFILILIDLETAKDQNIKRFKKGGHMADQDYIEFVYYRQLRTTKDFLNYLKPDAFYIVNNKNGKYKFLKHTGDEILKRKVDKYISFKNPIKL